MASTITAGNATNGLALSCDNTGILELKTGTGSGTTAITADASQNVTVAGTLTAPSVIPSSSTAPTNGVFLPAANTLGFSTASTERARIDSSGKLLVGSTNSNGGLFKVQAATDICLSVENATVVSGSLTLSTINNAASANIPLDFRASSIHASGGIATTASGANAVFSAGENNKFYRSTSALKYKQDIRDLQSIDINKFRPVVYKSKCEDDDQTKDYFGIIADEVAAEGFEELVTRGVNDEIEGFQYERLTVVLLKAIQELKAELDATKAEVAALKGAA